MIMLENASYQDTFAHPDQFPYLARQLTSQGELLPNYYRIAMRASTTTSRS